MKSTLKDRLSMPFLIYLRELAKLELGKVRPVVIGVTGSAGKTSTLEAIAAVLSEHHRVKVSVKANSETGIPLNILGISAIDYSPADWLRMALIAPIKLLTNRDRYDYYIAEMGVDSPYPPKNMEYLLTIVKPTIGVFLNALPVHGEYFDTTVSPSVRLPKERREEVADRIAEEKGKLIRSLPKNGTAVLNLDDHRVAPFAEATKARVISISTIGRADVSASDIAMRLDSFSLRVREGKQTQTLKLKQPLERNYAQSFLAAIAVGRACGVPLASCIRALENNFRPPPGRMSVFAGIRDTTILDSSYNASPESMASALELLDAIAPKRKVAVLGDMRELGKISQREHERIARLAAGVADCIITVGPMMKRWAGPVLRKKGFSGRSRTSVLNAYEAAAIIPQLLHQKDTVLVKGSQNTIFLEIVVEALLKHTEDAKKLCRREPFWQRKRQSLLKGNGKSTPVSGPDA